MFFFGPSCARARPLADRPWTDHGFAPVLGSPRSTEELRLRQLGGFLEVSRRNQPGVGGSLSLILSSRVCGEGIFWVLARNLFFTRGNAVDVDVSPLSWNGLCPSAVQDVRGRDRAGLVVGELLAGADRGEDRLPGKHDVPGAHAAGEGGSCPGGGAAPRLGADDQVTRLMHPIRSFAVLQTARCVWGGVCCLAT